MSLETGSRISCHNWTDLPIPDTAIARVEAIALKERQPLDQPAALSSNGNRIIPLIPPSMTLTTPLRAPPQTTSLPLPTTTPLTRTNLLLSS